MTGHGSPVEEGWEASDIHSKEGEGNALDKNKSSLL